MLDLLTGRTVRLAAQAAVLVAVVGGTVVYEHHAKDVTLVVDGRTSAVQADASDVRGLLADEGISVSRRDLVSPAVDTPLHDGEQVVVRFGRPLTVTVDGVPRTYWTTALTVSEALDALGIRLDGAQLSTSRSQPLGRTGLEVAVSHPKSVTLVADGRTRTVTTTAGTVGDLLSEQGLTLRPQDQLSVLPTSPVVDGLVVALTRIELRRITVSEPVPPSTVNQPDPSLSAGRSVVVPGAPGSADTTYEVVLADGRPTSRTEVASVVVKQPVDRVVKIGSGSGSPDGGSVTGADDLNWAALARCESGGNPRAVNPAGYYGLYQFSPGTWRAVGGSGLPSDAPPSEQLYRAKLLYQRGGAGQWGCGRHLFD